MSFKSNPTSRQISDLFTLQSHFAVAYGSQQKIAQLPRLTDPRIRNIALAAIATVVATVAYFTGIAPFYVAASVVVLSMFTTARNIHNLPWRSTIIPLVGIWIDAFGEALPFWRAGMATELWHHLVYYPENNTRERIRYLAANFKPMTTPVEAAVLMLELGGDDEMGRFRQYVTELQTRFPSKSEQDLNNQLSRLRGKVMLECLNYWVNVIQRDGFIGEPEEILNEILGVVREIPRKEQLSHIQSVNQSFDQRTMSVDVALLLLKLPQDEHGHLVAYVKSLLESVPSSDNRDAIFKKLKTCEPKFALECLKGWLELKDKVVIEEDHLTILTTLPDLSSDSVLDLMVKKLVAVDPSRRALVMTTLAALCTNLHDDIASLAMVPQVDLLLRQSFGDPERKVLVGIFASSDRRIRYDVIRYTVLLIEGVTDKDQRSSIAKHVKDIIETKACYQTDLRTDVSSCIVAKIIPDKVRESFEATKKLDPDFRADALKKLLENQSA